MQRVNEEESVAAAFSHTYLLLQLLSKWTKGLKLFSNTASKQAVTLVQVIAKN